VKKKILIVDDEEEFRSLLVWLLQQEGYDVLDADSGDAALEIVKVDTPDLVICDIVMMGINGYMVREFLREDPRTAEIPIILMTGKAVESGAWGTDPKTRYFTKPFPPSAIVSVVQDLIGTAPEGQG